GNCPLWQVVHAILSVRDRVTARVVLCIPDQSVPKQLTDQIKAISVLARTNLLNVVAPQPSAPLFGIHGFHTCYLSRLSFKRICSDKRDNSVTFCKRSAQSRSTFFHKMPSYDLLLERKVGGFAGEMQMFENLPAKAEK